MGALVRVQQTCRDFRKREVMSEDAKKSKHHNIHKKFYETYAPNGGPNPLNAPTPPDGNCEQPAPSKPDSDAT